MILVKRIQPFHSSQHTANLASKTIQDQECCPVKPTICKNDCPGALRNLPVITKDVGFKPAFWQTDRVKSIDIVCVTLIKVKMNMIHLYSVIIQYL